MERRPLEPDHRVPGLRKGVEMKKTTIATNGAPGAIGPYSQAVRLGNLVFVSGQLPLDPETGEMPDGVAAQTRQSLANVQAILEAAGSDLSRCVRVGVFMTDLSAFQEMNGVYEAVVPSPYPARSCVEVAGLPKGAAVEVEVIAEVACD